jgi:hypothetical protein
LGDEQVTNVTCVGGFEKVARYFRNTWTEISTTCTEAVSFEIPPHVE